MNKDFMNEMKATLWDITIESEVMIEQLTREIENEADSDRAEELQNQVQELEFGINNLKALSMDLENALNSQTLKIAEFKNRVTNVATNSMENVDSMQLTTEEVVNDEDLSVEENTDLDDEVADEEIEVAPDDTLDQNVQEDTEEAVEESSEEPVSDDEDVNDDEQSLDEPVVEDVPAEEVSEEAVTDEEQVIEEAADTEEVVAEPQAEEVEAVAEVPAEEATTEEVVEEPQAEEVEAVAEVPAEEAATEEVVAEPQVEETAVAEVPVEAAATEEVVAEPQVEEAAAVAEVPAAPVAEAAAETPEAGDNKEYQKMGITEDRGVLVSSTQAGNARASFGEQAALQNTVTTNSVESIPGVSIPVINQASSPAVTPAAPTAGSEQELEQMMQQMQEAYANGETAKAEELSNAISEHAKTLQKAA